MKTFFKKSHLVLLVAILFCHPLMALEYVGDIRLETQAQVDAFSYTSVTGNMRIIDNPNLSPEFHITSLAALSGLTEIGGNLYVSCHISNFNGLHNLVSIGGDLNIAFMGVTDMTGLGSLETIGGSFIFDHAALTSFNGLTSLREIGGRMYLCGDSHAYRFNDFSGLESLTTLGSLIIGDDCEYPPNHITSFNGLSGLTTITGSLKIIQTNLRELHGLPNLTSVGDLVIKNNLWIQRFELNGLEVVTGSITIHGNTFWGDFNCMPFLNTVGGDLIITGNIIHNDDLANFCWLYNLLSNDGLEGLYNVTEFGSQQIIIGCPGAFIQPIISELSAFPETIYAGKSSTLELITAYLQDATDWYWYSGDCGGTLVGTGNSITVSPASTTTYFVRGEGWKIMNPVECNEITVTVIPPPVAGSLTKTPDSDVACEGTTVSAKLTPGTGGDGTDVLEFRTCSETKWSEWSAYTSADEISTTGLTSIEIRTKRLGGTCDDSDYSAVAWSVKKLPDPPKADNVTVCWDGSEHTAMAILYDKQAEELVWYTNSTGSIITTAPTGTDAGTYTAYAASKYPETGCESTERTLVKVTINPLPVAPTANNVTVCWDGSEHTATAILYDEQTEELVWYTNSTGSTITTAPTGTDAGTYTAYAASKYPETGCESTERTLVKVTINPLPVAPTANNVTVCYDGTPYTGGATGQTGEEVVWYNEAVGGSPVSAPSGTEPGTYTGYAAAKNIVTGCESAERTLVKVTINPLPDILDLINSLICEGETAILSSTASEQGVSYQLFDSNGFSWGALLEGTGSGLKWFDVPVGAGYYVVGTNQTTHCMSKASNLADVIVDFTEVDASESSNPVPVNSTAMLKATVSPAIAGESVFFQMNGEDLGESVTDENGLATFEVYLENVGVYRIDAETYCSSSTAYLPVYDPTAGFVTGGGWINSPAGAYTADQSLTGKASFGFVSKYKKGQSTPDGNTEFQFQAGNLNFKSTKYDWLIIAGTKAMFKGEGIINDNGSYGFRLSAIDDEKDKFRIKIWDKDAEDAVVYDNNIGAEDNEDPTTVLGGGSIVIHSVKKKSAEILSDKTELNLNVYPNPFQDKVLFLFISPEDVSAQIDVYDITGRKVKTIFNDLIRKEVTYTVIFEPKAPISGIYIYRMTLGDEVVHGKLLYKKRE